jgi:hypothetical protein
MSGSTTGGNTTVSGIASKYITIQVACSGIAPILRTDVDIQDYITGNSIISPSTWTEQLPNLKTLSTRYNLIGRTAATTAWGAHYIKPSSGNGTIRYTQAIGV